MTLDLIRSHTLTAGKHVGDVLWWTLADARISRSVLESVWTGAGLSATWLPEPPTPEKALKTAIRESAVGQHERLVRLGKEDDGEIVFAILLESRDGAGNVSLTQEARVRLDRRAPASLDSDCPGYDLVIAIRAAYDRLLTTHTPDDVRRALVRTLGACAAVTLRDHGGVYWVPAPYAETLRKLQQAVSNIGASRLDVVPIHESPEATAALGDAARASIEEEITALRAEIDSFLSDPPERASTLARRLEAFESLRSKARIYHDVLQVQVHDLESALDQLSVQVEALLETRVAA